MLNERIESLLNKQITNEFFSSQIYLSMSAWFSEKALDGFAKWYYIQTSEERDHALIIYNYILKAGGNVYLQALDQPRQSWDDVKAVLVNTLEHERFITKCIYDIVEAAQEEKDFKTAQFFQWFVDEQVQEEDNSSRNLTRFNTMGFDGKALYMLDAEMGTRIYTKTPLLVTLEAR